MTADSEEEDTSDSWAWKLVFGAGWLIAIAVTVYLTRDLDPRSWLPSRPDLGLPQLPWYLKVLLLPGKFLVLAVVVGLITAATRRLTRPPTDGGSSDDAASPQGKP